MDSRAVADLHLPLLVRLLPFCHSTSNSRKRRHRSVYLRRKVSPGSGCLDATFFFARFGSTTCLGVRRSLVICFLSSVLWACHTLIQPMTDLSSLLSVERFRSYPTFEMEDTCNFPFYLCFSLPLTPALWSSFFDNVPRFPFTNLNHTIPTLYHTVPNHFIR